MRGKNGIKLFFANFKKIIYLYTFKKVVTHSLEVKLYVTLVIILLITLLVPLEVVSQDSSDIKRAREYVAIASKSNNLDTIKSFSKKAYNIVFRANDIPAITECANNLAYVYAMENNYDSAIAYYKHYYLLVSDDTARKKDMARTLGNLGICYKNTEKYMDMWNCFRQGKILFEELGDTSKICWTDLEIGEAYEHFGMFEQSREYYNNALALANEAGMFSYVATANYNIGHSILYEHFGDRTDSASAYLQKARDCIMLAFNAKIVDPSFSDTVQCYSSLMLAKCYMALLNSSRQRGDYADSCRKYLNFYKAAAIRKPFADSLSMETMRALLMVIAGKYRDALKVLESAKNLPVKDTYTREVAEVYNLLARCYAALGKSKEAYFAKKKYNELCDKVSNDENMKRSANFVVQTEIDAEREKRNSDKQRRDELDKAEAARQKSIIKWLAIGLVAAAGIAMLISVSLRKKHRLNSELSDRNNQLLVQRDIIERQKDDAQKAQSIILSSVEYASKIQSQAIGNAESVAAVFPESFVYYRPRNIVSGDWYMATILRRHRIMIEADCTGHGIPGALLCMLGVSAMKDIINRMRYTSTKILPGKILDEMRVAIKKALNKNIGDSKTIIDDGMDMTIVILPPSGDQLLFGGACQSAVLVSDGKAMRLKGDNNPIGNYVREKEHFSTQTVPVKHGDAVYLFSDGIQDQMGGKEERKFSFKGLMEFLANHYSLPMQEQMAKFEACLDGFVGDAAQVDDRTLVGIRI